MCIPLVPSIVPRRVGVDGGTLGSRVRCVTRRVVGRHPEFRLTSEDPRRSLNPTGAGVGVFLVGPITGSWTVVQD